MLFFKYLFTYGLLRRPVSRKRVAFCIYQENSGFLHVLKYLGQKYFVQDMRSNPINLLLTGMAVADMLVMIEYIPFASHMYIFKDTYTSFEEKVGRCRLIKVL